MIKSADSGILATSETMEKSTNSAQLQPSDRIKINVGGRLFETSVSTARSSGTDSLLSDLSIDFRHDSPIFIDRDPELFSVLLSVLRSGTVSSRFSRQELLDEASFYGLESSLRKALAPPPLSGIDASLVSTVLPASDGFVSAFAAFDDDVGSVWLAHGGQISTHDSSLLHSSTIRTHIDSISSICRVSPKIAAIGSESVAGVHFYDTSVGSLVGSAYWNDSSDPRIYKSGVTAVAESPGAVIFASLQCRHGENAVNVIDKSTLQIVAEFGRQSGNSSKNTAAGKLRWTPSMNVLVGASVSSGAFGCAGYIRLWDPRSGEMVWEACEPGSGRSSRYGDALADADVDIESSTLFKVCSKSGDLGMADMRCLGDDPWVYLEDPNPVLVSKEGGYGNSVVHCYRNQVFVGRDDGLQVWSKVEGGEFRRNFVDKVEDMERGVIRRIDGGGNRLFVCRDNVEGIEVWESSDFSNLISVL